MGTPPYDSGACLPKARCQAQSEGLMSPSVCGMQPDVRIRASTVSRALMGDRLDAAQGWPD